MSTRLKWRTRFTDTAPITTPIHNAREDIMPKKISARDINQRNRRFWGDTSEEVIAATSGDSTTGPAPLIGNRADGMPVRGKLIAELPADRFAIESDGKVHRIYDFAGEGEEESYDIAPALQKLAEHDKAARAKDRATVADQSLPDPVRLAAMNRLNRRTQQR